MAYFLERDTEDGPYTRARVTRNEPNGLILEDDLFEVGEPVHLTFFGIDIGNYEENQVFWITGFREHRGESRAFLATKRCGTPGELGVPVRELEKTPAMLRLALEAQ